MSITTNGSGAAYAPKKQMTRALVHITRAGRMQAAVRGPLKLKVPDSQHRFGTAKKGA